jgi:hypothetical protein
MSWSGGTYSKGNAASGGWAGDASLGIGIEAGRHDTQDNDFATGINQCLNKDGSNSCTGDLNLGGFKPVNLAAGTAAAPALCVNNDVNTGIFEPSTDVWALATNGVERWRVDNVGNVGIGIAGLSNTKLTLRGSDSTSSNFAYFIDNLAGTELFAIRNDGQIRCGVAANSPYNNTTASAANLFVSSGGELQRSTSSLKYKTEIVDYTNGLNAVATLRPVFYKGINDGNKQFAGLIAEEVHNAGLHEFVVYDANNQPDALHYGNMVALAFKAIQELNVKVEALEAKITELKA